MKSLKGILNFVDGQRSSYSRVAAMYRADGRKDLAAMANSCAASLGDVLRFAISEIRKEALSTADDDLRKELEALAKSLEQSLEQPTR